MSQLDSVNGFEGGVMLSLCMNMTTSDEFARAKPINTKVSNAPNGKG